MPVKSVEMRVKDDKNYIVRVQKNHFYSLPFGQGEASIY